MKSSDSVLLLIYQPVLPFFMYPMPLMRSCHARAQASENPKTGVTTLLPDLTLLWPAAPPGSRPLPVVCGVCAHSNARPFVPNRPRPAENGAPRPKLDFVALFALKNRRICTLERRSAFQNWTAPSEHCIFCLFVCFVKIAAGNILILAGQFRGLSG